MTIELAKIVIFYVHAYIQALSPSPVHCLYHSPETILQVDNSVGPLFIHKSANTKKQAITKAGVAPTLALGLTLQPVALDQLTNSYSQATLLIIKHPLSGNMFAVDNHQRTLKNGHDDDDDGDDGDDDKNKRRWWCVGVLRCR